MFKNPIQRDKKTCGQGNFDYFLDFFLANVGDKSPVEKSVRKRGKKSAVEAGIITQKRSSAVNRKSRGDGLAGKEQN